ncbi:MAG: hypothetical protein ACREAX_03265 [Candidatus Nitrosotenuis sp.]
MSRRGISEIVASILLITVVATVSFLAVNVSTKQITENEKTITEALHEKSTQIQELMSVLSSKTNSNKIILEIINYGMKEITLDSVLVDGTESMFVLKYDGAIITNKTIPKKKIIVLETNTMGASVQLITNTGNLIGIKIQ